MDTVIASWRHHAGRLIVIAIGAAALLLAGLYAAGNASADPYPPTQGCGIVAGAANVTPGETLTLTGSGFAAHASVGLSIESTPQSLGTVHTDGTGAFRDSVTLPADLAAGHHTIVANAPDQSCSLGLTAQTHGVAAVHAVHADGPHSGGGGSGPLASTGVQVAGSIGLAVVLLGGGALLLLAGRRRNA